MPKLKDYTNKICGCWKVLERDKNPKSKSHETFWISECQNCKQISSVRKTELDKNPRSCNNCKGKIISQTHREKDSAVWQIGDRYGLLTIIDYSEKTKLSHHTYVKVKCDCGTIFDVRLDHLKGQYHNKTISCGCISESAGEIKIKNILEEMQINFQKQYRVKNENNELMIFDFIIQNDNGQMECCIEFDGEQHFKIVEYFGGEEGFKSQQQRDKRKDEWCKKNNIPLIRIPYWDYDKMNEQYLFSKIPKLKNSVS